MISSRSMSVVNRFIQYKFLAWSLIIIRKPIPSYSPQMNSYELNRLFWLKRWQNCLEYVAHCQYTYPMPFDFISKIDPFCFTNHDFAKSFIRTHL